MDFKLLEAYQILQDEMCPQCGQPTWLCRNTDDRIAWKVESSICYSTRTKEEREWHKNNKGSPKREERQNWGVFTYATPHVASHYDEGTALPTRKEYYENV